MSEPLAVVAAMYEAFGRGDVPFILEQLADDVRWEDWTDNSAQKAGVPWLQFKLGRSEVLDFFNVVGSLQIHEFEVLSLMGNERQVAAEFVFEATPPGGTRYRDEELHLWTFNDEGKVVRFRHYVDTAKHIAAARAGSGESAG
jgi:ketosteroid isomerase-like protein